MDEYINSPLKSVHVIVSKRGTGKTNLIREWLLANIKNKRLSRHNIICWSGTAATSQDFDFLPKNSVRRYDEALCSKLCKYQMRRIELLKKRANRSKSSVQMVGILHVFDDVLNEDGSSIMFSAPVRWLVAQGRHSYQHCMFAVQHPKGLLSPILRGNACVMLMSKLNTEQMRVCYQLVSFDGTFAQFRDMINRLDLYEFAMYVSATSKWSTVKATGEHQREKYNVVYGKKKTEDKEQTKNGGR
jgi:hypothetical protein